MNRHRTLRISFLFVLCLLFVGGSRDVHAQDRRTKKSRKSIQSLQLKLLQSRLLLNDLYQKDRAQATKIKQLSLKIRGLYGFLSRLKKRLDAVTKELVAVKAELKTTKESFQAKINRAKWASHTSCFQLLKLFPNTKSGWHTIYRKKKPVKVYCDMKTAGGGWTRFIHHSDPNGQTPISQSVWDKGIQFAADGNIKQWLTKTYTNPNHNSEKKSKFTNAWAMTLATKVQGANFTHFKYHRSTKRSKKHRSYGTDYVRKTSLLPGSICPRLHKRKELYLYGEYTWCGNKSTGWLWMPQCKDEYSLLGVNDQKQTYIGLVKGYDTDGGSFEFFFR